ncbi:restriction endonuclease subunit S [Tenacibaculum piscium]|uniref:Type I restriction modification DNA specificity domain-containing protein n=1 Tax=Tenacibaculum piscium TaxID=1458515 RepID=A0A2H1YI83_9FLAO|nr:restriction endonuclease subunit S [Tenacibaculum piscium]MBE7629571.1 restriction endonuclease subunit S [Tenacibaculum piscium]SOS74517.1 conserved hypothetical protein [Tenacibaculum piscium]
MEIITKNNIKKYSTYKNSGVEWLGEIPEHWNLTRLTNIGKFSASGIDKLIKKNESLVKIINYTDVYRNLNLSIDSKIKFMEVTTSKSNRLKNLVKKGDLIFLPSSETLEDLGLCALVKENIENLAFSYHVLRFEFTRELALNFKKYFTNNHTILNEFSKKGTGSIRKTLNRNDFRNIMVLLPPLSEQTKIAEFLDDKTKKIDEAIAIKTQQINLLKERKQILIHKAVTRGLDTNVKLKNSGVEWIGEIPVHWEVKKVRYVFNLGKGLTITKENLRDKGIFCVNYGEIHSKYGFELDTNIHKLKCVNEDYLSSNSSALISNGDFIFADTSEDIEGSGNFTYLKSDNKIFAGYHTVIAKPKFQIESRFFAYIFESESFRNQIRTKVKGVKVYSITQSILKQPYVWFPSKEEQKEIVDYLDLGTKKIARAIGLKSEEIEKLKEYKSSLINSVVTGKVRVC